MASNSIKNNGLQIFIIIYSSLFLVCCSSDTKRNIVIENKNFIYEIGKNGKNLHFTDKTTGKDYIDSAAGSKYAYIIKDGIRHDVTGLSLKRNHIMIEFGKSGVIADVKIRKTKDYINFKVKSITGNVESFTFLNIPLKLEGMPYEPFAACVLSMNLFTHVRQIPALQTDLWATCYGKFGLEGAEITLLAVPSKKILPVIRKVMKNAKDVPHSNKGGAWALMQKEGYGSYLMNFGTLSEETVDQWISKLEVQSIFLMVHEATILL